MHTSTHRPSTDDDKSNKFSELRSRVTLLNEPRNYNYLGVVIERQLETMTDRSSVDYTELIAIYKIFLQNFSEINEGGTWNTSLNFFEL